MSVLDAECGWIERYVCQFVGHFVVRSGGWSERCQYTQSRWRPDGQKGGGFPALRAFPESASNSDKGAYLSPTFYAGWTVFVRPPVLRQRL
jgi:hypothetical protein